MRRPMSILAIGLAFVFSVRPLQIGREYQHLCHHNFYMEATRICEPDRRKDIIPPYNDPDQDKDKIDYTRKLESKKVEDMSESEVLQVLESYYGRHPYYAMNRRMLDDANQDEGQNKKQPAFPNGFIQPRLSKGGNAIREKCCKSSCTAKEIYNSCQHTMM